MGRWDARLATIADRIRPGSRVIDLGCGDRALARKLRHCTYVGLDKSQWDLDTPNTVVTKRFDIAVISGVLEYLVSPSAALAQVSDIAPLVLVSYDHSGSLRLRRSMNFTNHYSRAGIEEVFESAGWKSKIVGKYKNQIIYELRR